MNAIHPAGWDAPREYFLACMPHPATTKTHMYHGYSVAIHVVLTFNDVHATNRKFKRFRLPIGIDVDEFERKIKWEL